jgi:hypothetical protein
MTISSIGVSFIRHDTSHIISTCLSVYKGHLGRFGPFYSLEASSLLAVGKTQNVRRPRAN